MSVYLVSRHQGAVEWMQHMGHHYDQHLTHLENYNDLSAGDVVVGSLPINIVADLAQYGVSYLHLSLYIPEHLRGIELTAEQLSSLDARREEYEIRRVVKTSL